MLVTFQFLASLSEFKAYYYNTLFLFLPYNSNTYHYGKEGYRNQYRKPYTGRRKF